MGEISRTDELRAFLYFGGSVLESLLCTWTFLPQVRLHPSGLMAEGGEGLAAVVFW